MTIECAELKNEKKKKNFQVFNGFLCFLGVWIADCYAMGGVFLEGEMAFSC